jgi:hypothetical protein
MVQQIVNIPEKDMALFLELAKKMKWKIDNSATLKPNFILSEEQIAILEESSKTPNHLCLSAEESINRLNEL